MESKTIRNYWLSLSIAGGTFVLGVLGGFFWANSVSLGEDVFHLISDIVIYCTAIIQTYRVLADNKRKYTGIRIVNWAIIFFALIAVAIAFLWHSHIGKTDGLKMAIIASLLAGGNFLQNYFLKLKSENEADRRMKQPIIRHNTIDMVLYILLAVVGLAIWIIPSIDQYSQWVDAGCTTLLSIYLIILSMNEILETYGKKMILQKISLFKHSH